MNYAWINGKTEKIFNWMFQRIHKWEKYPLNEWIEKPFIFFGKCRVERRNDFDECIINE